MAQGDDVLTGLAAITTDDLQGRTPPSQAVLDWLHGKASTEQTNDIHHRIGFGDNDVSAGSHVHNGKDSNFIIGTHETVTDLPASPTSGQIQSAVNSINALFRTYLGTN